MIGWVSVRERGAAEPPREENGIRFFPVWVAKGDGIWARLTAWAAARRLRRAGVRRAVLPTSCPFSASFARQGIEALSPAPLYRATAAAIVRRYMDERCIEPKRATILFTAARVTPELRRAVEALCGDTRYLALSALEGGEAFGRELALRRGVALRLCAPDAALRADLTVCFDAFAARPDALRLDESLHVAYADRRPTELLAALWSAGVLDAKKRVGRAVYQEHFPSSGS